ncbi:hypothetical protein Pelub83DRAFT_0692 [Candidatus Pelagibacter ubique HIMB083]
MLFLKIYSCLVNFIYFDERTNRYLKAKDNNN